MNFLELDKDFKEAVHCKMPDVAWQVRLLIMRMMPLPMAQEMKVEMVGKHPVPLGLD